MSTSERADERDAWPSSACVAVLSLTSCGEDGSIDLPVTLRVSDQDRAAVADGVAREPDANTQSRGVGGADTSPERDEHSHESEESPTASESATADADDRATDAVPRVSTAPTATASVTVTATVSHRRPRRARARRPRQTDAANAREDSGIPPWVWWLLAAAGLAALIAAFLVPRSRRRKAWRAELAGAEGEATWFARELLPQLQQVRSREELAGAWQVSAGRVVATEDQLTGLEPTAPDEAGRARALELRDAVRDARRGVEGLVTSGEPATLARELGAIAARLSDTLSPPPPSA